MSIVPSRPRSIFLRNPLRLGVAAAVVFLRARPALAAPATEDIQSIARDVIRRLDLQTELPAEPEAATWHFDLPPEIWWLVLGVAVALLCWWLYANRHRLPLLSTWFRRQPGAWSEAEAASGGAMAAPAVAAADDLARQGRFAEAMHSLLLQSLADIRARLGEHLADSLTSREILRAARISDPVRAALRDIVARVEWTYFGEYPAGPEDYEECRRRFADLSSALGASSRSEGASA